MKLIIAFSCFIIASQGCKPGEQTTTPRPTTKPTTARPPYVPTTASTTTTSTTTTTTTVASTRPSFVSNTTRRTFSNPNAINGDVKDLLVDEDENIETASSTSKIQFPEDKENDPSINESDANKFVGGQTTRNGQEKICGSFAVFFSSVLLMMISS